MPLLHSDSVRITPAINLFLFKYWIVAYGAKGKGQCADVVVLESLHSPSIPRGR